MTATTLSDRRIPDGEAAGRTTGLRSAQRVVGGVAAQGVGYIFGVPGAKIDGVHDALADVGLQLPQAGPFLNVALAIDDLAAQIHKAEG